MQITILRNSNIKSVTASKGGNKVVTFDIKDGADEVIADLDVVLLAIGRAPLTDISLDKAGVELHASGHIKVDEWQNTTTPNVYVAVALLSQPPVHSLRVFCCPIPSPTPPPTPPPNPQPLQLPSLCEIPSPAPTPPSRFPSLSFYGWSLAAAAAGMIGG